MVSHSLFVFNFITISIIVPCSGHKHRDFMEAQIMFLKYAKDIAAGMNYLSWKSFVHRDLAARNILLSKSLTCKVHMSDL